jgi:hypothetical protein
VYLIEIFLPMSDNDGSPFAKQEYDRVRGELTERFGGVTAYIRSPAVGLWADDNGRVERDDLAMFEVMTDQLDRRWWAGYRERLEHQFRQEEIVMRATSFDRL